MRLIRPLIVLACGSSFLLGCEKRLDSPTPVLSGVATPQLVCDVQLTTVVKITGDGLTPVPVRTLPLNSPDKPQSIELPKILLTQTGTLDNKTATGDEKQVPDDLDNAAASHVKWASEMAMSFEVFPDLKLADGTYDITVKNPDGQATTLPHSLIAVPAPSIGKIEPPSICDDQADQLVTITGTGFLDNRGLLPSVTIKGPVTKTYTPEMLLGCFNAATAVVDKVRECTGMVIRVKKQDLPPGDYTITITNPLTAPCVSTELIKIKVNPPPTVLDVVPKQICQGGGTIKVTGKDFQDKPKVALGITDASAVKFNTTMDVDATFTAATFMISPPKLDVILTNPDGCSSILKDAVTVVPGPTLFFVDPPVVFNGITTQISLYTTGIDGTSADVIVTITNMTSGAVTTLTNPMIDPKHAKRILVNVPTGQPKGKYTVTVTDRTMCPASLPGGLEVLDMATVPVVGIDPSFGFQNGTTAVKITATSGLVATPRAYLNPHNATLTTVATLLSSVNFVDATKITAIVPAGVNPVDNPYDLIIVNPDVGMGASVGLLPNAYKSLASAPPVITGITPQSIEQNATVPVTISGANFRGTQGTGNAPTVVFTCITNLVTNATTDFTMTVTASTSTSITVSTTNLNAVTPPSLCTIKVTNNVAVDPDQPFATFQALAISGSSGNLSTPGRAGVSMPDARRALSLVANGPTAASRFLYAIGGDKGTPATATDTVFTIGIDEKATGTNAWFTQRYKLTKPRTLANVSALGRYIYLAGGNDGTAPVKTAERALVLDPLEAPSINDVDVTPGGGTGQGGGIWTYRVAALMAANDDDNPGGESLPSDVQVLQIPDLTQKLQIKLVWTQVTGRCANVACPVAGYVVYRTKTANQMGGVEEYLDQVIDGGKTCAMDSECQSGTCSALQCAALSYVDKGKATDATKPPPLVQGSTGQWRKLPDLGVERESAGVAIGQDPVTAGKFYVYATCGRSTTAPLGSYEFLPVTVVAGHQDITVVNGWTAGASSTVPRYQHSTYTATHENASAVAAGTTFIYVGGGTTTATTGDVKQLNAGRVAAGGDLGTWSGALVNNFNPFGHGSAIAANFLFAFSDGGASTSISAARIDPFGPPPAVTNFNNNGAALGTGRYLPGSALDGALIYLAGGSDATRMSARATVEWFIY